MKLLINLSNLYVGGGIQVALSFINELKVISTKNEYHIFLSRRIDHQIKQNLFPPNFHFYLIERSPASLWYRNKIVAQLNQLEKNIQPEVVFTVFGPSYWKPKTTHLMGIANGWIYNPGTVAYKVLSCYDALITRLAVMYSEYYIKRDAQFFVVETNDAKEKIIKYMQINENVLFVVGNTYSAIYNDYKKLDRADNSYLPLPEKGKELFRLVLISHNYAHKNLKIITEIIPYLSDYNVEFILTIDDRSYNNMFSGFEDKIINLGTVKHDECPSIYKQSDALFFPSLLETFSASYPEAMKMKIPILTSDLSFARDICKDAALYFDPLDPIDIANKIKLLIDDKILYNELIEKGKAILEGFETSESRALKYLTCCETIKFKKNDI